MRAAYPRILSSALAPFVLAFAIGACSDDSTDDTPADAGHDALSDSSPDVDDSNVDAPVELYFDLSDGADFWDRPFPLEGRRDAEGRPNVEDFPDPRNVDTVQALKDMIRETMSGFSVSGPTWFRFTGPIDTDALPTNPATYRDDPAAPVMVVDIDPMSPERGARRPLMVSGSVERDPYRPANLLQVLIAPGFRLREDTLYAIVVRGLRDASGRPVVQTAALARALAGESGEGALGARTGNDFEPLRDWLGEQDIAASDVVAATVFRTGNLTTRLYELAAWAAEQAPRTPSELPLEILETPELCAYQGAWEPPQFQEGVPPFETTGGRMIFDAEGHPVEQRTERAPFVVVIPKRTMPATGFPLLFYVNGTGGESRQVLDRGPFVVEPPEPAPPGTGPALVAAQRGFGASGVAGIMTPERLSMGAVGGYIVYNFFNPLAMRDNFFQTVIEHVMFRRLVLGLRLDPSSCVGVDVSAASDGMVRYDPDNVVIMGHSLGSYLSGMLSTLDPGFRGAILTGAGGSWVEFAFGARSPDLTILARFALSISSTQPFDRWHPGLSLFEWAVGPADNTHYLPDVFRNPTRDGRRTNYSPPHMLVIEGDDDDQISTGLQRALIASLGIDLVGDDVGADEDHILPWIELAGRGQVTPPVSANVETAAGPRTAGVSRYLPDFDDGGHQVAFQLEAPKHQYGCFLETLLSEGAPVLISGEALGGPCE